MDALTLSAPTFSLNGLEVEQKRAELKAYFNQTFDTYEALFETLANEAAYYEKPCSLRHPLIFYFGHTATFFTNKLVLAKLLPERINAKIESMCAIGVDEMSWDDLNDSHYDWPSVEAVRAYRQTVRQAVNGLIDSITLTLPIGWHDAAWPILMGIEHERIHLETSSVLIRQLPIQFVKPSANFAICPEKGPAPLNSLCSLPAGRVEIDHSIDQSEVYGWDNEYGRHTADVAAFKASQFLVSNQEFLAFVEDEGYQKPQFWSDEGNRWRTFSQATQPTFWVKKQQAWWLRCLAEEVEMPWNWPVEVNFLEAEAFCNWKAAQTQRPIRLPSEDEYLRLRAHTGAFEQMERANVNLQLYASSMPVNQFKTGDFYDVVGNVWQWTQTPIYPFEGYQVHPLYDDFTTPTFDNQHALIKGGSWISSGNEINRHSRYAFRRHFFQHAGFRYVESAQSVQTHFSTYETDQAVAQYCEFHYGDGYFGVENFAKQTANLAIDFISQDADFAAKDNLKVLEVGCSVGRTSFELAKKFTQVVGLDFSARFIQLANQMKETGKLLYSIPTEGSLMAYKSQTLAQLDLVDCAARCQFFQQDAANLKPHFTGYDMVVAANLIDRLYQPSAFLEVIAERLNPGGLLLITSPYTWDEAYTEKVHWLGGYKDAQTGEMVTSLMGLTRILSSQFEPLGQPVDLPFVIRETQRKFQHSLAEVTLWKKKAN